MKLLQEIQLNAAGLKTDFTHIKAGGPGSGRHSEGMHEYLIQNGFEHKGVKNGYHGSLLPRKGKLDQYEKRIGSRSSYLQHVSVHIPTGQWSAHDWNGDGSYKGSTSGIGLESLQRHTSGGGFKRGESKLDAPGYL